jgi:integrase/recombinase XerD
VRVQLVLMPDTGVESWSVLGDDGPIEPVERWLAYLTAIERSPNTVRAYADDLKDWFTFLQLRGGLDWREVRLEDLGEFVAWQRLPPQARDPGVTVLPTVEHHCTQTSVNRKLSALSGFYQHAARHGVDLGELLVTWQPAGRRGTAWKPFLHHIATHQPQRTIKLKAPGKHPRILTAAQAQASMTWSGGSAAGSGSTSTRTGAGTPTRPGCCATTPHWRSSASCSGTPR